MLISTHSLQHTHSSIHSASAFSFSVLVYPVHHLQSLPIPSLLLSSPPSVPLVRPPLFCSIFFRPFVPVRPTSLSSFIIGPLVILVLTFSHHFSPTASVYFLLSATTMT